MTTSIPTPSPSLPTSGRSDAASATSRRDSSASNPSGGAASPAQSGSSFEALLTAPAFAAPASGSNGAGRKLPAANGSQVSCAGNGATAPVASETIPNAQPALLENTAAVEKSPPSGRTAKSSQETPPGVSRDLIETVAAMLVSVLPSLPMQPLTNLPQLGITGRQNQPAQGNAASSASPAAGGPQAVIDLGANFPTLNVTLPGRTEASAQPPASVSDLRRAMTSSLETAFGQAGIRVTPSGGKTTTASPDATSAKESTDTSSTISVAVNLPSVTVTAVAGTNPGRAIFAEANPPDRGQAEKTSFGTERKILSVKGEEVNSGAVSTGIRVAKSGDTMPANPSARRSAGNISDPVLPAVQRESALSGSATQPVTAPARAATVSAPVLAGRAVETVMNVLNAQSDPAANPAVVSLHFKFGDDDLAVRVQLRGGEVHTQFSTDSAELRTELSNQWRGVTSQNATGGLRLVEPTFSSSGNGAESGFGSSPQGHFSSQQNPQQQQPSSRTTLTQLRTLRPDASVSAGDAVNHAPRSRVMPPTSLHLAAVA